MLVQDKILIVGIRKFEGEVEGTNHDFTKVTYIQLSEGLDNDREKGSFPKEVLIGDSKVFNELSKISYPAVFDATFNILNTRKGIDIKLEKYSFVKSLDFK